MRTKVWLSVLVLFSLLASCNMPTDVSPATQPPGNETVSLNEDAMATAVELTAAARLTEIANSVTATFTPSPISTATPTVTFTSTSAIPTSCNPLVTANVVANVRSGPDTAYDAVGTLSQGQTATIAGRNDASTWWYIEYPVGSGRHGWISGTVVTSACVPAVVQVVAAPPSPTVAAADNSSSGDSSSDSESSSGTPDLVALAMQYYVVSGKTVHVMVSVTNAGDGAAGPFVVTWWANQTTGGCHWTLTKLAAGKRKDIECEYTYEWGASKYTSTLFVDSDNNVTESNEGNNKKYFEVKLH